MQYDVIVLGATFAAAGMLSVSGGSCMVLERRPQAGYEFMGALRTGGGEPTLYSAEARELRDRVRERGGCLYDCAAPLYERLQGRSVMLNMETVSVERGGEGFAVTAHGVSGYRTYRARRVVDTRIHDRMIRAKAFNLLASAAPDAPRISMEGVSVREYGVPGDVIISCRVAADADYVAARARAAQVMDALPDGYRVIYMADAFDCELLPGYPQQCGGVEYVPSGAWADPLQAFDAGAMYARGEVRRWTYP